MDTRSVVQMYIIPVKFPAKIRIACTNKSHIDHNVEAYYGIGSRIPSLTINVNANTFILPLFLQSGYLCCSVTKTTIQRYFIYKKLMMSVMV